MAALCGLPVESMVSAGPLEAVLWNRVTQQAGEVKMQLIRYQANQIAVEVSKMFK